MSAALFLVRLNRRDKPDKTTNNGIQIVEKHRNELPADTALHARLPRPVRRGGRIQCREELPVRPAPAREDLRARPGQVADAGPLARPQPEPAVEAREHVRRFHELFFTLAPDRAAIESNINRALFLCDKSAYHYSQDLQEKGYYNRVVAGNINQQVQVDSVVCDFDTYPYRVTTYARQMIIRESNVTERSLVTRCNLINSVRSDNNPQGFTMERFEIVENRDLRVIAR